jgi:hypothetical protein
LKVSYFRTLNEVLKIKAALTSIIAVIDKTDIEEGKNEEIKTLMNVYLM